MSDRAARADAVVRRLRAAWTPAADPTRAAREAAYMRGQFAFLGLSTPIRRRLARPVLGDHPPGDEAELASVARGLWAEPAREVQDAACDHLRSHVGLAGPGFVVVVRELVSTKSWWDTVDALASRTVGPLLRRHPALGEVMGAWVLDDNIWVARAAL